MANRVSIPFEEAAAEYMRVTAPDNCTCQPGNFCRPFTWNSKDGHYGGSIAETRGWVESGFYSDATATAGDFNLTSPKRRRVWDEFDGDPDIDRLLQADDNPFRTVRRVKESREGITLNIGFAMNYDVNHSVITEYAAFVLKVIAGLEANGHDLEVNLIFNVRALLRAHRNDSRDAIVTMPVKRFGELSDYTRWSVMFSPSGWRQIGFTALVLAAQKLGTEATNGLGSSESPGYDVRYDAAEGILTFLAGTGHNFPADRMQTALKATGIVAE